MADTLDTYVAPRYRSAGRRAAAHNDREASANAPLAALRGLLAGVAGAPGDLEALVRLLPGLRKETVLPTSEDVERVLPLRSASESPVGRAFTEAGKLGGGFYMGPGSPLRALAELPGNVARAGREFAQAGSPVHVIKPKGGNWLSGSVEDALKGLRRNTEVPTSLADLQNPTPARMSEQAINNWIDKQLTRYVQKEMATPEDPIRALAERGVLHYEPRTAAPGQVERAMERRVQGGFPAGGYGESALARQWENASDRGIYPNKIEDLSSSREPWMDKAFPGTIAYSAERGGPDLGFNHLIDELRNATNPASGLPRELLLKYESLPQVSVPQAVERVAKINEWRAAQMAAAKKAAREGIPVHKEYPEGYKWMAAPDTAVDERALKYIQDVGCEGGWCTQGPDLAKRYGGGGNQLYVLHGPKGEVVTQIMVKPPRDAYPVSGEAFAMLPQETKDHYRAITADWRKRNPDDPDVWKALAEAGIEPSPPSIVEIKGKQNKAPNPEYLPFVQDFVRSGKWSDIGDLHNTGLLRFGDKYIDANKYKEVAGELNPDYFDALLRNKVTDLSADDARILQQLQDPNFATGGIVDSGFQGYNPDLIAARAAELRAELFPE